MALTAFGTLFMVLGVLLLFDGGLLAVGNVRENSKTLLKLDPLHCWSRLDHRLSTDICILRPKTEIKRHNMLLWRRDTHFHQKTFHRNMH